MSTTITTAEFVAEVAAKCGPGEAALILVYTQDGVSYCVSGEEGTHSTARSVAAGEIPADDDLLLGVAVVSGDGTLTEYPVTG